MKMKITDKQKELIDCMNEFCREKLEYDERTSSKEASDYIDRNIEEYKLETMDSWMYQYM